MIVRTSRDCPLRIDVLAVPGLTGVIGLTFCPGKVDHHARTGAWERDLATDVAAIRAYGATTVLTLLEDHEFTMLKVPGLGRCIENAGLTWFHLPIPDGGVPGQPFEDAWDRYKHEIHQRLGDGEKILVHCRGGLGRTGLLAGLILVESGCAPGQAIAMVRQARRGCIENNAQERYVREATRRPEAMRIDRIRACLLAGACGDALGAPVEFMTVGEIVSRYGNGGIRDYDVAYGGTGMITDDTQMTLFTVESLIRAWVKGKTQGLCHVPAMIHLSYMRWLMTQGVEPPDDAQGDDLESGWLIGNRGLWTRRAPGNTCLSALGKGARIGEKAGNDSKGCGGVMRAAPAGFAWYKEDSLRKVFELGSDLAGLTHGHPSGHLAAGFFAVLVHALSKGACLEDAIQQSVNLLTDFPSHEEVLEAVTRAVKLARKGPSRDLLPALGQGWVAEEALAIAIYCAMTAETLEESVVLAVNHSGDSDSTGSMTGQIRGVMDGYEAIPSGWQEGLELRETIDALARDYARMLNGFASPEALKGRYPGY